MTEALLRALLAVCSTADPAVAASVVDHAEARQISPALAAAVCCVESGCRMVADRGTGVGAMQVIPHGKGWRRSRPTREQLRDVQVNAAWGVGILRGCVSRTKSERAALRCYNGGADSGFATKVLRLAARIRRLARQEDPK